MVLKLQEVDAETDFHAISRCLFESHEDPPQKFFHLWFPIHGNDKQAREDAIEEGAMRLKRWHTEDPSSNWRKVVDTGSGRIAGAALWNIYNEHAPVPDDLEVTWFPAGGAREFVEQMITEYDAPRAQAAQRPHVYLFVLFTHPDYRRKGVGQQLLSWGMKKADELRLEVFLDSTSPGRPLYEANSFSYYVQENRIRPKKAHPDRQWQELEKKVGPMTFWPMKRPVSQVDKIDKAE